MRNIVKIVKDESLFNDEKEMYRDEFRGFYRRVLLSNDAIIWFKIIQAQKEIMQTQKEIMKGTELFIELEKSYEDNDIHLCPKI